MAQKGYKIKRNMRIHRYRSPWAITLRTIFTVVIVAGLAFVGWSAYGPISAFLAGNLPVSTPVASSKPEENAVTAPVASESEQAVPSEPEPSALPKELRAIYLPTPILADTATLDQHLDELAAQGYNALLFDLKNSAGRVVYRSAVPEAAAGLTEDPFDLAVLCQKLSDRGIIPIGRLHAFRDPVAADAHRGMSVKYMNTQTLWLDNTANQGGKPWLNPYSSEARTYILNLAAEAAQMGVKQILFDSVNLPVAFMLEYASFGAESAGISAQQTLSTFVEEAEIMLEPLGAQAILYVSGPAALGAQNTYYGGNPLELSGENIMLGMMPSLFGDTYTIEAPYPQETGTATFTVDKPILNPFATLDTLYTAIVPGLEGKQVIALLQGASATGSYKNNKIYTTEDINEQIRALTNHGITNYVLYSSDGIYPKPNEQ